MYYMEEDGRAGRQACPHCLTRLERRHCWQGQEGGRQEKISLGGLALLFIPFSKHGMAWQACGWHGMAENGLDRQKGEGGVEEGRRGSEHDSATHYTKSSGLQQGTGTGHPSLPSCLLSSTGTCYFSLTLAGWCCLQLLSWKTLILGGC